MLLERERHHGLGMDALVTVCSWTTKVIMIRFGHGCSADPMLLEQLRISGGRNTSKLQKM